MSTFIQNLGSELKYEVQQFICRFDEKTPFVTIKHDFDLVNKGPSYTIEEKVVRLFLPKADFIESMSVNLEKNNCLINSTFQQAFYRNYG